MGEWRNWQTHLTKDQTPFWYESSSLSSPTIKNILLVQWIEHRVTAPKMRVQILWRMPYLLQKAKSFVKGQSIKR